MVFRSTPELGVLAPLYSVECGHSSDFVLASPCSPRLPVFLVSPYFSWFSFSTCSSIPLS